MDGEAGETKPPHQSPSKVLPLLCEELNHTQPMGKDTAVVVTSVNCSPKLCTICFHYSTSVACHWEHPYPYISWVMHHFGLILAAQSGEKTVSGLIIFLTVWAHVVKRSLHTKIFPTLNKMSYQE